MPKTTDYPGVSIVPPPAGSPFYQLYFKHPLLRDSKGGPRQIKRSIQTPDKREAKALAIKLSSILRNPAQWRALPETTPPILQTLWTGDVVDHEISKAIAIATLNEVWPSDLRPASELIPLDDMSAADIIRYINHNKLDKANALARNITRVMRDMLDEIAGLRASLKSQVNMNKALGANVDEDYNPKTIEDAIEDFYSDDKSVAGTGAKARRKNNTRAHVRRFAAELPDRQTIQEITPDDVISHLAKVEMGHYNGGKKPKAKSVKEVWKSIAPFMNHQTRGLFKPFSVKSWIKTHLNGSNAKKVHPVWLEQGDVTKLLAKMPEYWRAVALVQWGGAFRPEELCHIQTANIKFNGDIRVGIDALLDGERIIWEPKEKNSYGAVNMLESCRDTLKKLLQTRGAVLFPNDEKLHGYMDHPKYKTGQGFERENQVWNAVHFCKAYLAELRKAAKAARLDAKAQAKLVGRTLRSSAGKRFLLSHDFNVDLTATFMRNTPAMIRDHYATLLPDDIKQ